MLFYQLTISYKNQENISKVNENKSAQSADNSKYEEVGKKLNTLLGYECKKEIQLSVVTYRMDEKYYYMVIAVDAGADMKKEVWKHIHRQLMAADSNLVYALDEYEEITVKAFRDAVAEGDDAGLLLGTARRIAGKLKLNYDENNYFSVEESLVLTKRLSYKNAFRKAEKLMVEQKFSDELERIYSKENLKKFYGHPVHYHIIAGNENAAQEMLMLLLEALYANKRILGKRINRVTEIKSGCYDETDFQNLICNSQGGVTVIPLNFPTDSENEYATGYEEAIAYIGRLIKKYQNNVLFVFVQMMHHNGFSESMLGELGDAVKIMELSEGTGDRAQAIKIFEKLIDDSEYKMLKEETDLEGLPEQMSYKLSEVYNFFASWKETVLRQKVYKAYQDKSTYKIMQKKEYNNTAYEKLQNMVGLAEIKSVIEQIVSLQRMQKIRLEMGCSTQVSAMHMIFTGNPGSAKTTVARLLTEILKQEGIIRKGKLVECGRADLVGKYVGWTAKAVQKKFEEAAGGVLFIDEAYSLVDSSNSFGDEAINTIVQEMENRRSDVIVIFAGYPDKMQDFLNKNEGLRSRITFHINFPDYTPEELVEILRLMINGKGYSYDELCIQKCKRIFEKAVNQEEFGNGRYVRNLLEQAIMKQSQRLLQKQAQQEITKEELLSFVSEDFEVNAVKNVKKNKMMGFCVNE